MNRSTGFQFLFFFVYLFAQIMLFKNLVLFSIGLCFPYIAFILLISVETSSFLLILLSFILGIAVDIFYGSLGIHASALVLLAFIRNFWLAKIMPHGGYDVGVTPTLSEHGVGWFLLYTFPLVFLYHIMIFFIEIGGFQLVGYTLLKVVCSTLFTQLIILLLQYLFYQKKRNQL